MNTTMRVVVASLLVFILVASGFAVGFVVDRLMTQAYGLSAVPAPASASSSAMGAKIDEVFSILQSQALKPPNETTATSGAIQGLISANGDKYAEYFTPKSLNMFQEQTQGSFGGIGVVLGETSGTAAVVQVYPGTPAAKAGVKKGDTFVTINKETRPKWPVEAVVSRVRGPQGTKVTVTFKRPSTDATYSATMTRAQIKIPNTETALLGNVGYVRLNEFNAQSDSDLRKALSDLKKKGAKGYVLDLRDNPGGLLEQAVDVSSLFIPSGVIVKVDERGKPEEVYRATGALATGAPLVVLVNQNSASASEITGGALQDSKRAKLVGVKSYGKGSVQTIQNLSFGGAIKFTIAHYLTPNGHAINGIGLHPDFVVPMTLARQFDTLTPSTAKRDVQLQKALQVLQSEMK